MFYQVDVGTDSVKPVQINIFLFKSSVGKQFISSKQHVQALSMVLTVRVIVALAGMVESVLQTMEYAYVDQDLLVIHAARVSGSLFAEYYNNANRTRGEQTMTSFSFSYAHQLNFTFVSNLTYTTIVDVILQPLDDHSKSTYSSLHTH